MTCSQQFLVSTPEGLHLRPAALLVKAACRFNSKVTVHLEDREADAKSLMSVLTLEATTGAIVTVKVTGDDADEALMEIARLFAAGAKNQTPLTKVRVHSSDAPHRYKTA